MKTFSIKTTKKKTMPSKNMVQTPKRVQGPYKVVKKKDGNRPVKIY